MKRKGFSMIELIFVMFILAGLVTIVIPKMQASQDSTKLTKARYDMKNIFNLIQKESINEGGYSFLGSIDDWKTTYTYNDICYDKSGNGFCDHNNGNGPTTINNNAFRIGEDMGITI